MDLNCSVSSCNGMAKFKGMCFKTHINTHGDPLNNVLFLN